MQRLNIGIYGWIDNNIDKELWFNLYLFANENLIELKIKIVQWKISISCVENKKGLIIRSYEDE